jgi:hypothetical protein
MCFDRLGMLGTLTTVYIGVTNSPKAEENVWSYSGHRTDPISSWQAAQLPADMS